MGQGIVVWELGWLCTYVECSLPSWQGLGGCLPCSSSGDPYWCIILFRMNKDKDQYCKETRL